MTEKLGTKKRGVTVMRVGAAMLVFGVAIALAFSYGQEEPGPVTGLASVVAFFGFITAIVGLGIWRERPTGD